LNINIQDDTEGCREFKLVYEGRIFQEEEIVWLGAQICAKGEFHPSELLGKYFNEENTGNTREKELWKDIEFRISRALSNRKSARK